VADTIDPMGGSYLIEHLTDEIEARARDYIERIDAMGGALAAIENGYVQGEINDAAYAYQRAVESGEQVVVGVNKYATGDGGAAHRDILRVDPAIEQAQRDRLAQLRAGRDNAKVAELRARLEAAARGSENLMPLFITCVENDVTLGEICHTLRGVFGEYRPQVTV